MNKCVIIGGADIGNYERARSFINDGDYVIYCDCGLRHMEPLGVKPSLIIGDFDSYSDPGIDVETIVLPVAKDDTDTVYAVKTGIGRGFRDFVLLGVIGGRTDHTLVNIYALFYLDAHGCKAVAADDYSEMEVISSRCESADGVKKCIPGTACVTETYPFFSLVNMTGNARGVTIRGAKFCIEDAEITSEYQYATSNEVLPGHKAEISVRDGRLLLIRDIK